MIRETKSGIQIIDVDYDEAARIAYASTSSKVEAIQAMGRVSRASLEENTRIALTTHQDVKIPDGPIVMSKDLLQDIRDSIDSEAIGTSNEYLADLRDKLDKIYPFLC